MDDLIIEFLTETNESLSVLDLGLVSLEKNPHDPEILGKIFRVMHTIKGTCGFLGLPRLSSIAHASENVLGKIREGHIEATPALISIILRAIDHIKTLIDQLEKTGAEPMGEDHALIAALDDCALGKTPAENLEDHARALIPAPAAALPVHQQEAVAEGLKAIEQAKLAMAAGMDGGVAGQSIRVAIDALEKLVQTAGELVLTRNQLLQVARQHDVPDFSAPLQRLNHIATDLQEGVMKTRMQPIGNAWNKFPRLIRDLAIELHKKIDLTMLGADTALDRQMLEMIKDPLTHMIRNAADHGIETPEERRQAGKPETGTILLSAHHEGGHIVIKIADDGRGIDVEKMKRHAIASGLATEKEIAALSDQQIYQFIFTPGFSTAENVTAVSGRGVGMDVVITHIEKAGGSIALFSEEGKGSSFIISIPLTLAVMPALIVECAGQRFALPQMRVSEIVALPGFDRKKRFTDKRDLAVEEIDRLAVLRLRDRLVPLFRLKTLLQMESARMEEGFAIICQDGAQDFGLVVDRVFDTEEIVVKPVAAVLKRLAVYAGCTILSDGIVAMILEPGGLLAAAGVDTARIAQAATLALPAPKQPASEPNAAFLMFRAGGKVQKCVKLESVSRLEKIDAASIEWSGNARMVPYRGGVLRIITLDDSYAIPDHGKIPVIVLSDGGHLLGIVVQEIIDMTEQDNVADPIDVGFYFAQVFAEWAHSPARASQKSGLPHVLLVDDSLFFRRFMQSILTAVSYRVTTAESAVQALQWLEQGFECNAIITDIDMPEMDGIAFLRKLRGMKHYNHIPMVALSSFSNDEILSRADDIIFDGYVSKANRDSLVETLGRVLKKSQDAEG